jgi:NTE family protein
MASSALRTFGAYRCGRWLISVTALWLTGCAFVPKPDLGTALQKINPEEGYRASSVLAKRADDDMLVILSFSGGGMRASAMAYGVLEQLAHDQILDPRRDVKRLDSDSSQSGTQAISLIDTVDVISGVSGGAVPAAYYALYGKKIFKEFTHQYLYRDITSELRKRFLFSPKNWWRLADKNFNRADILTELFDDQLFENARFSNLDRSGQRPFLIVNATDIGAATRFEFTQDEFDRLCLDLEDWPISRAVAASSAVPALITPVTLRNRAGQCGYSVPEWVSDVATNSDHSTRHYQLATSRMLRSDKERYGHLHLVDGALSDNLGVGAILDALSEPDLGRIREDMPPRLVILMVNAGDSQAERIGGSAAPPGFFDMLRLMGTVPVDRYTAESKAALRDQLAKFLGSDRLDSLYFIEVELSALRGHPEWGYLATLPTSFTIERAQADSLRDAARQLLRESSEYRRWMNDLRRLAESQQVYRLTK